MPMNKNLPNQLTVARMVLAVVFFVMLGLFDPTDAAVRPWLLNASFVVFVVAAVTDVLDGHIARKYDLTSTFGRIVDPFVDKLLIVGGFVMLTGTAFAFPPADGPGGGLVGTFERQLPHWMTGGLASGVQAWMVVVILCREFLVSGIRGYAESQGVAFGAVAAGKAKMLLQTIAIGTILFQMANVTTAAWAVGLKVILVWLAVGVTVYSGAVYVVRGIKLLRHGE